jgi:hypothetical protein
MEEMGRRKVLGGNCECGVKRIRETTQQRRRNIIAGETKIRMEFLVQTSYLHIANPKPWTRSRPKL